MGKEPKTSYDIIADAVRTFWEELGYPTDVVAFFKQKYDFDSEDEWEECEELCSPCSSDDYTTVCFECDFCEGETDVKDIRIVPLQTIIDFYIDGSKPSTESKTVRMVDQSEAYEAMKHEAETHELPASREAYERAARIIDQMKPVGEKPMRWVYGYCDIQRMRCWYCEKCGNAAYWDTDYGQQLFDFCPYCGQKMQKARKKHGLPEAEKP